VTKSVAVIRTVSIEDADVVELKTRPSEKRGRQPHQLVRVNDPCRGLYRVDTTIVASIIMYSLSASLANNLKIRSKTPLFAQRPKR
jgi:hypothetical protein